MDIPFNDWRNRLRNMASSRDRMTLMAWFDDDYYHNAYFLDPAKSNFDMYPDEWFIAPTFLVRAHSETVRFLEFIEANLEAYRLKTRHRKRMQ